MNPADRARVRLIEAAINLREQEARCRLYAHSLESLVAEGSDADVLEVCAKTDARLAAEGHVEPKGPVS